MFVSYARNMERELIQLLLKMANHKIYCQKSQSKPSPQMLSFHLNCMGNRVRSVSLSLGSFWFHVYQVNTQYNASSLC